MKKIFAIVLMFAIIPTTILLTGCSSIADITLNTDNVKLIYDLGEEFTSEGLIVTLKNQDNTSEAIIDYTVDSSAFNNTQVGTYEILVYAGKKDYESYSVEVKDKGTLALTSLNTFYVGQDITEAGITLTYTPTEGSATPITDYKIVEFDNSTTGKKNITVEYDSFTYTLEANVVSAQDYFELCLERMLENQTDPSFKMKDLLFYSNLKNEKSVVNSTYTKDGGLFMTITTDNSTTQYWLDSTGKLTTKKSYLDASTLPSFASTQYDSYNAAILDNQSNLGNHATAYTMYSSLVASRYYDAMASKTKDVLVPNYSTKNGIFTYNFNVVNLKNNFLESYSVDIDLTTGNLAKIYNPEATMIFNEEIIVPALPAAPTIENKGTLAITGNSKFYLGQEEFLTNASKFTLTLGSTTYPVYAEDCAVSGFETDTVGTKQITVTYNSFTYPITIEVVSLEDYITYMWNQIKSTKTVQKNITSYVNKDNYVLIEEFSNTLYSYSKVDTTTTEYWIETNGTVTKSVTINYNKTVTSTKYDSQELAIKAVFELSSEMTPFEYLNKLHEDKVNEFNLDEIINPSDPDITSTLSTASCSSFYSTFRFYYNLSAPSQPTIQILIEFNVDQHMIERVFYYNETITYEFESDFLPLYIDGNELIIPDIPETAK